MKKIIALMLCLLACSWVFAGGASEDDGVYVFAADATWPPFEFIDENGNLTGFEVELVPMIGEHVGVEMRVENIAWDTIFAGRQCCHRLRQNMREIKRTHAYMNLL